MKKLNKINSELVEFLKTEFDGMYDEITLIPFQNEFVIDIKTIFVTKYSFVKLHKCINFNKISYTINVSNKDNRFICITFLNSHKI